MHKFLEFTSGEREEKKVLWGGASISHALFRRTIIKLIRLARTSQNVLSLLICASLAAGNLPIRGMHQGPLLHIWFLNWKYALFVTNGSKIDQSRKLEALN